MNLIWDQKAVVGTHTFVSEVHADFANVVLAQAVVLGADTLYASPSALVVVYSANQALGNFTSSPDPTKDTTEQHYLGLLGPLNVYLDTKRTLFEAELLSNGSVVANITLENVSFI